MFPGDGILINIPAVGPDGEEFERQAFDRGGEDRLETIPLALRLLCLTGTRGLRLQGGYPLTQGVQFVDELFFGPAFVLHGKPPLSAAAGALAVHAPVKCLSS